MVRFRSSTFESFYFYHALVFWGGFFGGRSPHPGGFLVVEIYFILGPQHGLGGRMAWIYDTLLWKDGPGFHNLPLFPSAVSGLPLFVILIFGGFPGVFYVDWPGVAFYLLSSFRPHFLVDLVQSFFYFFGIFWYFFMFGSAWLCILRFFFHNLGGRCVFLEGVQKSFEKVEMLWSNFQKARDARARGPNGPC